MSLPRSIRLSAALSGAFCALLAAPAVSAKETMLREDFDLASDDDAALDVQQDAQGTASSDARQGPPAGVRGVPPMGETVFDDTWATVGIGVGLVPSYSGSDNYRVFPLPLIVGRVGGIGITPNGAGFTLDLLSQPPGEEIGPGSDGPSFSFGPAFRFRNDRADAIGDDVVRAAGELETAFEVGANAGVSFSGILTPMDRLGVGLQARWDVAGAHDGMLIEPSISYLTPLGRGSAIQIAANASFVDDSFADYYYSVSPAQSEASGLPQFTADGGLDSVGTLAILTFDLDGNVLNGGFSIYTIAGYSRIVGDGADTPYTSLRGSADQFIGGVGVAYTF